MPPPSEPNRRLRRGQTLVLFAFTLILLALAVTLTLSFTTRVKQKIEAQTVADASAYSNAIVTARTYNAIGLMNRAQIAHMVAQAGANSLISYSSYYWGHVNNLMLEYYVTYSRYASDCDKWIPTPTQPCSCQAQGDLGIQMTWLALEQLRLILGFNALDAAAGNQARRRWYAGLMLYTEEELFYRTILRMGKLDNQKLPQQVAAKANNAYAVPQLSAPSSGDMVTTREVGGGIQCTGQGATCDVNALPVLNEHAVMAAMASRGWRFVTGGVNGSGIIQRKLRWLVAPQRPSVAPMPWFNYPATGSGYWSANPIPLLGNHSLLPVSITSMADSHGLTVNGYSPYRMAPVWMWVPGPLGFPLPRGGGPLTWWVCFGAPNLRIPAESTVIGSNGLLGMIGLGGEHLWNPGPIFGDMFPGIHRSSLPYPGVWPPFVDYNYNKVSRVNDNWGQPKNMAVIQRNLNPTGDPNAKPDPWNLFFKFRFTPTGEDFDNRGFKTVTGGIDLSKQTVLATGQAYYHRQGAWAEVPNMLNPFWRATLVAADVDLQGQTDPAALMNNIGNPAAADVYTSLRAAGFKGIH